MIQKLKTLILSLSLLFTFAAPVTMLTGGTALAAVTQNNINGALCQGSNINVTTTTPITSQNGTANCPENTGLSFTQLLSKIINILSLLVGAVAVIMIIVGGFRYVTSAGNDSATAGAKKTILYALVGLIIVAVAQVIVHFVLNTIAT